MPDKTPAAISTNPDLIDDNEPRILTPGKHTSHSQVEMYTRCSWQWYLRYVKGIKEPPKLALGIGKGGHAALEFNAKTKIRTSEDLPLEHLRDIASDLLDAHTIGTETDPDDLEPGKAKDAAIAGITHYRMTEAPKIHPIAAEWEFNLDLNTVDPNLPPLRIVNGKIDLIDAATVWTRRSSHTEIGVKDYKFVSKKKSQADVDLTRQLPLYDLAIQQQSGVLPTQSGFGMFVPGNTKEPARFINLQRSPAEMAPAQRQRRQDRLIHTIAMAQRGIEAAVFIPTDDQRVCSWCGYRELCQYNLVKDDFLAAQIREAA